MLKASRPRTSSPPPGAGTPWRTTVTWPGGPGSSPPVARPEAGDGVRASGRLRASQPPDGKMIRMATRFDTSVEEEREEGIAEAGRAIQRGRLVVIPTDTVYGIAADAFNVDAVAALLAAKGRGRQMPPPVLVSARTTLDALAMA